MQNNMSFLHEAFSFYLCLNVFMSLSRGPTGDNRPDPAVIPGDTLKKSSIPNSNSTIIKVNHDQANNKTSSTNRSRTTSSSSSNNNSSRHRTRAQEYATEQASDFRNQGNLKASRSS